MIEVKKMKVLKWLYNNIESALGAVLFAILIVLANLQVAFRAFDAPLAWTEEYMLIAFVWMIYLGASACTQNGSHVRVDMFMDKCPVIVQRIMNVLISVIWIAFTVILAKYSFEMIQDAYIRKAVYIATKFPMWVAYLSVLVGMIFMFIRCIENLVKQIKEFGNPVKHKNDELEASAAPERKEGDEV